MFSAFTAFTIVPALRSRIEVSAWDDVTFFLELAPFLPNLVVIISGPEVNLVLQSYQFCQVH